MALLAGKSILQQKPEYWKLQQMDTSSVSLQTTSLHDVQAESHID